MIKVNIADKETLDSVKEDTTVIRKNTDVSSGTGTSVIKSIQRGLFTKQLSSTNKYENCGGNGTRYYYYDVTIEKIDITKSVLLIDSIDKDYGNSYGGRLVNSTTLRIYVNRVTGTPNSYTNDKLFSWQVIEFN